MADLLVGRELPPGFRYPSTLIRSIELDADVLEPWSFLEGDRLRSRARGLRKRFRKRVLVPFAERQDNDDVACFDIDQGNVCIVHDYASSGWERRQSFVAFEDWLHQARTDHAGFESA